MTRRVSVIGAPSAIGLVPTESGEPRRLDLAPDALREQELVGRLGGRDLGDVEPPRGYRDIERPAGRVRNEDDVASHAHALAERIAGARREDDFIVVLGGDCSIILGALLGVRAVDPAPPGVVYLDAHADFATLDESPSGSACSMALALAAGREDRPLARLADDGPLTACDLVAHIGRRDEPATSYGDAALEPCGVLDLNRSAVESRGPAEIAENALGRVARARGGFWVHFDVDVLDPNVMPATGDPAPGGIDFDQATDLLRPLVGHARALGLQITLYDPTLDSDGAAAARLVGMLEEALAS